MNRLITIGRVLVVFCLLAASRTWADEDVGSFFVFDDLTFGGTTINFDTDAAGNPIAAPCLFSDAETLTELYAPLGVHFAAASGVDGGAILNDCSAYQLKAHSGSNLLAFNRTAATASGGRATEPETITFDTPVPNVSIYAAGGFAPQTFRLDAYDAHGRLVDSSSASTQDWAPLSVKSDAGITRMVLSRDTGARKARVFTPDVAGAPGDTISIPVQIDDTGRDVAGASVTLQFDDALSVTDPSQVTLGSLLAGGLLATNIMMPGSVTVAATGSQGQDGPGALLIVTATIPAGAMLGTHPLMLSRVQLNDSMGNPIPVDTMSGTFTVKPMGMAAMCGDLNGNGKLDVADATLALRIGIGLLMPTDAQMTAACGNPINVAFATRVLRAAIGLSGPPTPRM